MLPLLSDTILVLGKFCRSEARMKINLLLIEEKLFQIIRLVICEIFEFVIAKKQWYWNTGRERLIRSHSSARFCFELSGNSN